MTYGKQIGPTGRKRDEYNVFATGKDKKELNKPYRGSTAYHAYGQVGVKEAKQSVHHKYPHKWVKFSTFNLSRTHRTAAKRRQG